MLKNLIPLALCLLSVRAVAQCSEFDGLTEQQLWETVRPNSFQIYFILTVGSLSVLCLILTIITWKIYPSFSVPSDIMFAICWAQLFENTSLVISSIYSLIHNEAKAPPDFPSTCTAVSILFTLGNTSSTIYNMVFCAVLSLSIRKPLKGTLFSQYRYHAIVVATVLAITLALSLTQALGTGLNGICGYKLQDRESFARFAVELLIVGICLFSMYMFRAKVPKSSYFQKASVFGYYYYYMGLFSVIQALNTIGYLIGNISCQTGTGVTGKIIQISITFGTCESIILSFILMALRFSHPVLRMKIRKLIHSKLQPGANTEQQTESEQVWLGSLVQSIKGSQIISFLSGVLISFAQHEYKIQKQLSITKFSFRKNYLLKLNQGVTDEYMIRRMSNGANLLVKHKLGGLRALEYDVRVYAIEIFAEMLARTDANVFRSFNINENLYMVKEKAYSDGGKSGEFFFGTYDNQFLIKTITQDEAELYIEKIQDFYEYYRENPYSMIAKILGLYKFTRRDTSEQPIYLILMRNVSPYDRKFQERVYDIKGSQFNRSTIDDKNIENPQKLRNHTLKDEDFKKLQRKICIEPAHSQKLRMQLKKDAQFLGRMSVMDYSILIIKRKGRLRQREQKQQVYRYNQFPSYAALDEYYNIGIIDYLQSWTLKRKAERAFKTMITKKKVTVTSPEEYSNRLSEFIDQIL